MVVIFHAIIFESQTLSVSVKKCWPKTILTWHSHSRSFKVIDFALQSVTGRQRAAYHHIILLWSFRKSSHSNCQKLPSSSTHSHLTTPPSGTHANIRMHLIFPETRVTGLHFCRWQYGSSFIQICAVGSKRCIFSATECVLAVQGHPRSMILVPIDSTYATSY